ncbi:ATP-binding protein [Streptomyces sp. NBC_00572]|uniref:ATP-binding protein n=1 Tax=Streptomyces sp. NBC_00572 TaxID=2903664 RepID=UPI0022595C39|nr:ATP-binding protein [Streptomyces sp. NBC_00572]MCX4982803.1 ATP-binding protein [Streptomyces sp. NBC_00572]
MIPDPNHPWGLPIDYAGRGTVTENGHTIGVRLYDNTLGGPLEPDPMTGEFPAVYVTAQISETGETGAFLRGYGLVTVNPANGNPAVPDPTAVQRAVEASLADFETRRLAYAALCAAWVPAAPEPDPEPTPETPAAP